MKNLNVMTDEKLAVDYVNGDNRAFDELLLRHQSKLFSYILFVVHNREIADDLFQETFVKVIHRVESLELGSCALLITSSWTIIGG